jgi:hemolysin activation/secretion protein
MGRGEAWRGEAAAALGFAVMFALLLGPLASPTQAQESARFPDLPGSRPLVFPPPSPSSAPGPGAQAVVLADVPEPEDAGPASGLQVFVSEISIEGNSIFAPEQLAEIVSPFVARRLNGEDLHSLREALTQAYVKAGYANSWAVLPDQDFSGGVLQIRIVEGVLADVVVTGNKGFTSDYLRGHLIGPPGRALNAFELEARIRALSAQPGIRSIQAVLRPGVSRDKAVLFAEVREASRLNARLEFGDIFNPLIGEMGGYIGLNALNPLVGRGDRLGLLAGLSEGLTDFQLEYGIPIAAGGTRIGADFRYSEAEIVDASLEDLDIRTRYMAAALTLAQPVWQRELYQVEAGLRAEWRESRSTILGFPFAFSPAADSDAYVRDFVIRFSQSVVVQTGNDALAFRSTWNLGLNALGATSSDSDTGIFTSWLGQAQWLRRLEGSGIEFFARGNVQLALDPLLPFERFSVGGRSSVRGYRENQEVRDNGYSLGLEARIPILREPSGRTVLRVGPFFDSGRSWSEPRGEETSHVDLASVGLAAVWSPSPRLRFEFVYGYRLIDVEEAGDKSLQDYGIEFRVVAATF